MFGLFKKRTGPDLSAVRELLFGDVPLADWRPNDGQVHDSGPWSDFDAARAAVAGQDASAAIAALRRVVESPKAEARQQLQAWHFLRQLGVQPDPDEAKRVRGVVLEVHQKDGLDTLAAYSDGTARYLNHSGKLIVWDASDPSIGRSIDDLLRAGQRVADRIGPWEGPRRGPPPKNHLRLTMLTASGLHFGEGTLSIPSTEPMAGPVLAAGTALMLQLTQRAEAPTA
jgi:hypothetical protein